MEDSAKNEILEAISVFSTGVDESFIGVDKRFDDIEKRMATKKDLAKLDHDLKDHIDRKISEYNTDLFKKLEEKYQIDKHYKKRIVELFKANQIGSPEDLAYLEGLAAGG